MTFIRACLFAATVLLAASLFLLGWLVGHDDALDRVCEAELIEAAAKEACP